MTSLSGRALCALSALAALAGCGGAVEGTPPVNTTNTPVVTAPVVAAPVLAVPPPAVATPPVAAAPVVPTVPVVGSGTTLVPVAGAARLSAAEVRPLLADNTIQTTGSNGRPTYYFLARDGRLKYRQDDYVDGGSWRVTSDGMLCTSLARINAGVETCNVLYRDGTNFRLGRTDGTTAGGFTVLPGNTQNL